MVGLHLCVLCIFFVGNADQYYHNYQCNNMYKMEKNTHQKHKQYSQQQNQYKMRDKVNPTAMKLTNLFLSI